MYSNTIKHICVNPTKIITREIANITICPNIAVGSI